ncbi:vitamin B12 ABC transporter ATP-binding protein BtuD [Vibrio tritonius]|uniref:vitamin B12 ABC transporter ATP-binding protein BtuD n=1 Tax=Vibrio tritonius TaxID=1435069 RepID=UPI00315E0109
MIRIKDLQVGHRLLPLSFECEAGEVLHILGPNGCGKSTLLGALAGMTECQGEVWFDDVLVSDLSLPDLALKRAFLPQAQRPSFNLDVFQYLALSLPACIDVHDEKVLPVVNELSELLNISDKLHRSIHQLSGGEWQRVRLAGCCLQIWPTLNPYAKMLILDEPAAPLDIAQEALLYKLIAYVKLQGITVVMANHDLNRSLRHADRVVLLRKGVVESIGLPTEVLTEEMLACVFNTSVKLVDFDGKSILLFE